jgi:hypothetical protein
MKNKFIDFVCGIKSGLFKVLVTILIFGTMMLGLVFTDHDMFSIRTISGILFAGFGYGVALGLALIRYSKGIKD